LAMTNLQLAREHLHTIPTFRGLTDAQLDEMTPLFQRMEAGAGDVLFERGEPADACYLLTAGAVSLFQDPEQTHTLHPPVLIGDLGTVTDNAVRNSRAEVQDNAELWKVPTDALLEFFEGHPHTAVRVLRNMLAAATDKFGRDHTRLADMRGNIIRTQKSMKKMRDFLLDSEDTSVSKPIHEVLEGLIRQNRRVNYRVGPPQTLAASVRTDDGFQASVVQISRTHVSFRLDQGDLPKADSRTSGVLQLSGPEIPISGKVLRTIERRVDLEFDLLIDEYAAILEGYLTRVQMLDFLV
jgi:CRP/FNR family cyclic AMP-dependent transcriptional regulator